MSKTFFILIFDLKLFPKHFKCDISDSHSYLYIKANEITNPIWVIDVFFGYINIYFKIHKEIHRNT